jgi:type I restriction enzyme R subunit
MRLERATQNRVISLFKDKLNYRYLGNLAYEENLNLRETDIKAWLVRSGYSRSAITNAINYIKRAVTLTPIGDLYIVNKEVYSLLRYGFCDSRRSNNCWSKQ